MKPLEDPDRSVMVLDLTGIGSPPAGLVEMLAQAQQENREIELLNPSLAVQEALRAAKVDSFLMIRGATL